MDFKPTKHYIIEYQDVYPYTNYMPVIYLLFILFIILYLAVIRRKLN